MYFNLKLDDCNLCEIDIQVQLIFTILQNSKTDCRDTIKRKDYYYLIFETRMKKFSA